MLPKQLKYGSKVESAMADSYRSNIQPQNNTGPYTLGQTIIINIPTANNLVLATTESYLKFNIQFAAASAENVFRWDSCGAHGIIQRLRIFSGSNLIQDIDNYGLLAKMLFDLQVSTDASYGRMNNLVGTRNDLVTTIPIGTVFGAAFYGSSTQVNSGEAFHFAAANALYSDGALGSIITTATSPRYYCLNLISLLGSLNSSNYFPLFACTSAPIRLEIQLVANVYNAGLTIVNTSAPTLNNVEYVANFIKLSDKAMEIIYASIPPETPLQFCVPDYSNYQYNFALQTGSTQVSFPIAAKYSSLKSIFVTIRDQPQGATAITFYPYSCVTGNLTSYYFRIGSQIMPTKQPDNYPEMFSEVLKAMGSMSDLNYQPSIEKASYELQTSTSVLNNGVVLAAGSVVTNQVFSSGSFYIGIDLENYVSSPKDSIFCGLNTNTSDIFAVLNFGGTTTAIASARFDAFAMFDSVIVFESQTCYRKF
jgi:hypothetical protein